MIVADAGPLIGLARIERLVLLRELYERVLIPPEVFEELRIEADRPGSRALREATSEGWITVQDPSSDNAASFGLDPGELAAIRLAKESGGARLLIDERRGRSVARRHGLPVIGTGGLLVTAKRLGLISAVANELDALDRVGYRLSPALRQQLLELAEET